MTARANGHLKWLAVAVPAAVALAGMWQYTAASTAELRERMTAIETALPLLQDDVRVIRADVKTLLRRLP